MRNSHSPIYFISLGSSADRRESLERQLLDHRIEDAQWITAFDGRQLSPVESADHDPAAMLRSMGRPMTGGEYGCYRSHLAAIDAGLASGAESFVVLEDDAVLLEEFDNKLSELEGLMDQLDPNWQVVHLAPLKIKLATRIDRLEGGTAILAAHYFPMTTTALLWSRSGALNFISSARPIIRPVDNQMREHFSRCSGGYAVCPSLARPAIGPSVIDDGPERRKRVKRNWYYGVAKQRRLFREKGWAIYNLIRFRWARIRNRS